MFWILISLSNSYPASVTVPVRYINIPGKKVVMNELPTKVTVNIRATGFRILSYDFERKQEPVTIDIGARLRNIRKDQDVVTISTQGFLNDFSRRLGHDAVITGFQPDSIVFSFSDRIVRPVPVVLDLQLDMEKQYDTTGLIAVTPSVIEVSGPPSLINAMDKIKTEPLVLEQVKGSVKKKVKLLTNKKMSYSAEYVDVFIPVEKFTEGITEVPVQAINIPKGYSLKTFPDKVKVRYIVTLSRYNRIRPEMFRAVVDAKDLEKQHPDKVVVLLTEQPDFIRHPDLETERLDYIMRKE